MPTEDVAYQQRLKIRRTTLGFGVIQVILGLALTALSFTAFVLSESEKIRNACPYWAGFTVFCSGGVGIVAWRHSSVLSMGLFTFFSAVCVVLHMIGTILTGEVGGLLKSIILCHQNVISQSCMCCDSIMTCKQNVPSFKFEGVEDCSILTGLLKELLYSLCVLNIFGSLVCFIATILGCTSVARQAGRDQPLFRRRLSAPSDSHEQSQYSWLHYPTDLNMLPPYAPPIYRSVDNFQDCGATPYIVPPPVFDPTDLPPPYSSRNASLSSSGFSLYAQSEERSGLGRSQLNRDSRGRDGSSSIVIQEVIQSNSENQFQQRIYSENRGRPGNPVRITSAILTRSGVLEFHTNRSSNHHSDRAADQSLNSSRASLQSEARRPLDIIGQRIEGIAQHFETRVFQRYEKAEECKELDESVEKLDRIQDQKITNSQHSKWKYSCKQNTNGIQRHLSNVDQSAEIIRFEDRHDCSKTNNINSNLIPNGKVDCRHIVGEWQEEEEPSSNSDSGLGDDLSPLCQSINSNNNYKVSNSVNMTCNDSGSGEYVDTEKCPNQGDNMSCDERSRFNGFATNPGIDGKERSCNTTTQDWTAAAAISEGKLVSHPRNFEQSILSGPACDNEYGMSNNLFESLVDNNFEGDSWNVFGASSGLETLTSVSGNDSESFQQVPMLAKLYKTPNISSQDCEELGPHQESEKNGSQELVLRGGMLGQFIKGDTATYHKMIPKEGNHHQLMPSDASYQEPNARLPDKLVASSTLHGELIPSDEDHCLLIPSDASHHQSSLNTKQQDKLVASNEDHQSVPTDHQWLIPLDASHQGLLSNDESQEKILQLGATHHQLIPSDIEYFHLIPDDAARRHWCLQPDYNTVTEESVTDQEANITGLLIPIDGQSDLHYSCHHFPAPVSEVHVPGRQSPENATCISLTGYVLDSKRSAECHQDEYSEPVLELKSFREKCSDNSEFMAEESGKECENVGEKTGKETFTVNQSNTMPACSEKHEKCNSERKMEDYGITASSNRQGNDTDEVIQLMDNFFSSNMNKFQSDGLPVVQMGNPNANGTASSIHVTLPSKDSNQLESSMSSGRSSVNHNCSHSPDESNTGDSLATNFAENLNDSGSEREEKISVKNKPLARSDTCIAMEANYLTPREKTRTCSDPEVKGLGITRPQSRNHRKVRNHRRLLYDDCIGMVPPNIELPIEIRNQGLGYCPDESRIQNWNTGKGEQRGKQRTTGSANNLVQNRSKTQSCHHKNRDSLLKNKSDLLKKEKALMKTIKLRNEMSRSLLHLYRERKLNPSSKDSESLWSPASEISRNALKKRRLAQKVGDVGNCELVLSVEYPRKAGHPKYCTRDVAGTGQNSAGKETFV